VTIAGHPSEEMDEGLARVSSNKRG
jgi:hypothetical protein